jgi:Tol biopolymer transport system component
MEGPNGTDLWTVDMIRGTSSRLTFHEAEEFLASWSPDGDYIVFASERTENRASLFLKRSDGSGPAELLLEGEDDLWPYSWSPDGRFVIFGKTENGGDLWMLPLEGDRTPRPIVTSPFAEAQGNVSPNGRWIAYISDESGAPEVYVQAFPEPHGRWQISTGGGSNPSWAADGRQLYFYATDQILAVPISEGNGTLTAGRPRELLRVRFEDPYGIGSFDVSRDGSRFFGVFGADDSSPAERRQATLILNWFDELRRLVPPSP